VAVDADVNIIPHLHIALAIGTAVVVDSDDTVGLDILAAGVVVVVGDSTVDVAEGNGFVAAVATNADAGYSKPPVPFDIYSVPLFVYFPLFVPVGYAVLLLSEVSLLVSASVLILFHADYVLVHAVFSFVLLL